MNIEATRALIPVQPARQPVMAIEQKVGIHSRQNHHLREKPIPMEKSRSAYGDNFATYDKRLSIPAIKGKMVDVYA